MGGGMGDAGRSIRMGMLSGMMRRRVRRWTPLQLPNLFAWLDAAEIWRISTLTPGTPMG